MDEEIFVDIYPCACGHCTECGINFVPTEEETRRWAMEDENYNDEDIRDLLG